MLIPVALELMIARNSACTKRNLVVKPMLRASIFATQKPSLSAKMAQIRYKQNDRAADDSTQAHTDHQHSIPPKEALNRKRNLDEEIEHEHGEG